MTREFTGRNMAFLMIAFFAVVISVNILMAVVASKSWTGLVVKNSYVASQQFNEKTAEMEHSAAMKIRTDFSYRDGVLRVHLADAAGANLAVNAVDLRIGRPSNESEDKSVKMSCSADGTCTADLKLAPGLWTGEIESDLPGLGHWLRPMRLVVDKG